MSASFHTDSERWRAVEHRDRHADGAFVYAVATTGIYCRPGCPSRLAQRKNVAFYDTPQAAEQAGFRACQRCHPNGNSQPERHAQAVAEACRIIETSEETPDLEKLATAVGLSQFHFHRIFKAAVGLTPRQYTAAHRAKRVRQHLRSSASVTEAIYEAGFNSNSRFYEHSAATLGMTPSQYRNGGSGTSIAYSIAPCPLGLLLVAGTDRGICAVALGEQVESLEDDLRASFPQASRTRNDAAFREAVEAVVSHLDDPARELNLPLDIRGTAFQQQVWQTLRLIPVGETSTYTEVAQRLGRPSAVRAVARACATNPLALVIPCHRVVGITGKLSGYRWGLDKKKLLLAREAAIRS